MLVLHSTSQYYIGNDESVYLKSLAQPNKNVHTPLQRNLRITDKTM